MDKSQSASNDTQSPSELPSSEFSSLEPEPHDHDDPFELLAKGLEQRPFTTIQGLRNSLEGRRRQLQQDKSQKQYLVFTSVPLAQYSQLSKDGSPISKFCRLSFNSQSGILIAKVMPGDLHDAAVYYFNRAMIMQISAMNLDNEVLGFLAGRVTVGNWTKEADSGWGPFSQRPNRSLVLEVGMSQSSRHLALDARGWLETPSSSVKLAVTVDISRQTRNIMVHRWELGPRAYGGQTIANPPCARRSATIQISRPNNTTTVAGQVYVNGIATATTQLPLPFDKIVGRSPQQPLERDFVLSAQDLTLLAETVWRHQGLL